MNKKHPCSDCNDRCEFCELSLPGEEYDEGRGGHWEKWMEDDQEERRINHVRQN